MAAPAFVPCPVFQSLAANGRATVGEFTYGDPEIFWWGEDVSLSIGKYCSIARGVGIFLGGNHRPDWITTFPFSAIDTWPEAQAIPGHPASRGNVTIGHDVWIGANATILSGVAVGDGAVIGAAAVVTRDVLPYCVVAGNPAKLIRRRFSQAQIDGLLSVAWWDRPDDEVRRLVPLMLSSDVDGFLSACGWSDASQSGHDG